MAKRKVLVIIIALVLSVSLCAFSSGKETSEVKNVPYSKAITVSSGGTYFFFRSDSQKEYVDFLESLDKEKYEIVDITIQATTYYRNDCFMITYSEKTTEIQ